MPAVQLREVRESDLPEFLLHYLDIEAWRLCGLGTPDSTDRAAFLARWHRNLADPEVRVRTIVAGRQPVGYVAYFKRAGQPEVSYWLGREHWGRGYATEALGQLLREIGTRPLYGRVARTHVASRRVLEKCGFRVTGEDRYEPSPGVVTEEFILTLGA